MGATEYEMLVDGPRDVGKGPRGFADVMRFTTYHVQYLGAIMRQIFPTSHELSPASLGPFQNDQHLSERKRFNR